MSEHKEFDKYIKDVFKEDTPVPQEFSWDSMDISIPVEEKKNRKPLLLFILLLTLAIGSTHYYSNMRIITNTNIKVSSIPAPELNSKKQTSQSNNSINNNNNSKKQTIQTTKTNGVDSKNNLTQNKTQVVKQVFVKNKAIKKTTTPNLSPNSNISIQRHASIFNNKSVLTNRSYVDKPMNIIGSDSKSETTSSKQEFYIQSIPNTPLSTFTDLDKENIPSVNIENSNKIELLSKAPFQIVVNLGGNNFGLAIENTNVLKNKLATNFGFSTGIGIRRLVNKKWNANINFNIDRFHSTFNHTRDLDPIINPQSLKKVTRKEVTHHNNFTNTISLQLGLDYNIYSARKFEFFGGFALSHHFVFSRTGKTTDDTIVSRLQNPLFTNSTSISAGLNSMVLFSLNEKSKIGLSYNWNKSIAKGISINNDIYSKQQSSIKLTLVYKMNEQ